jgi:Protein of unknown function with HXXEE motif
MTLDILLWAFLASFVVHIVDETTMNGGFIRWMQATFWPTYSPRMNFFFNGGALVAIAASNVLYDLWGGHWIILALAWPAGFALHGVTVHVFWTIRQRNLSPGLVTSVLYWIMAYLFVRYGLLAGRITGSDFWTGTALGALTIGGFLTFVPSLVIPRMVRTRSARPRPGRG